MHFVPLYRRPDGSLCLAADRHSGEWPWVGSVLRDGGNWELLLDGGVAATGQCAPDDSNRRLLDTINLQRKEKK